MVLPAELREQVVVGGSAAMLVARANYYALKGHFV